MPTNILVIGGAGYIGSHMLLALKQIGYTAIVLDNLSTGKREAVLDGEFIQGDYADPKVLADIFTKYPINAVMFFAVLSELPAGMPNPGPGIYYQANIVGLLNLLNSMVQHKVKNFVYASSDAVYGEAEAERIHERYRTIPLTPLGRTQKMAEDIIRDFAAAGQLQFSILRHFQVAGADPTGKLGDMHTPATRLIPQLLEVAAGKREFYTIQGDDYPTGDGTYIRDYLHVSDLCNAYLLALRALLKGKVNQTFNLGNSRGYSVKQVISSAMRVTKRPITVKTEKKILAKEPAMLIADPELAKQELGWQQRYQELDTIIQHAWQFMQKKSQ